MTTQTINRAGYTIKGLKTFMGMEHCGGFNVTLYRDGKPVCFVINEDNGGEYLYEWKDGHRDSKEEATLRSHVATLPPQEWNGHPEGLAWDADMFVERLVSEVQLDKEYRRRCKTQTVFTLHDQPGGYSWIKRAFTAKLKARIEAEHGDNLKEIINERYGEPISEKDAEDTRLRKLCQKHTVFILKSRGEVYLQNRAYTAPLAAQLREHHGDDLAEIINERYGPAKDD